MAAYAGRLGQVSSLDAAVYDSNTFAWNLDVVQRIFDATGHFDRGRRRVLGGEQSWQGNYSALLDDTDLISSWPKIPGEALAVVLRLDTEVETFRGFAVLGRSSFGVTSLGLPFVNTSFVGTGILDVF